MVATRRGEPPRVDLAAGRARQPRRRAEAAIDAYLASVAHYAASFTRTSEREAEEFLSSGAPASALGTEIMSVKSDCTSITLTAYRDRLKALAGAGNYDGPTELVRMRPDGTWEPLQLPAWEL